MNADPFLNTGRATDSLLTAGAAAGIALDCNRGLLRMEVEGRGRDALSGYTNSFEPPNPTFFYNVRAVDGWSVMANAWKDWDLTDRLGLYGGGAPYGNYQSNFYASELLLSVRIYEPFRSRSIR